MSEQKTAEMSFAEAVLRAGFIAAMQHAEAVARAAQERTR